VGEFNLQKSHNGKRYPQAKCKVCSTEDSTAWAAANPARRKAIVERHNSANPQKRSARIVVGNAIRDGKLTKGPCAKCGNPKVQAHHHDYSKPLDVTWLCSSCHAKEHRRAA